MKLIFPGQISDNFADWKIIQVTAMIGSKTNVFSFDGNIRMVEASFRIPNNLLEYQYDILILYTAAVIKV